MILTIGMIVKNEERYLRRCLEALAPILTRVDSELIIADTGSSDRTVEIAREFTDQVFSFKWCNDFSAARNSVLRRASGEWFLAVDADEIFENAEVIASFFLSGDYKAYHSAAYIQRNFNEPSLKTYSDLRVIRMTKRFPQTRYINPIHEILDPMQPPTSYLPAVALHYGYMQEDSAGALRQKANKYLHILRAEAKREPKNPKHYLDLERVHGMVGELEPALRACDKGIALAKPSRSILLYPLYADKAAHLFRLQRYDAALETISEYFRFRSKPTAFDLELHCLSGTICFHLKQYARCAAELVLYLKRLNEFKRGLFQGPELMVYSENSTDDSTYKRVIMQLVSAYFLSGDYPSALASLRAHVQDNWYEDPEYADGLIELETAIMVAFSDYSALPQLFGKLTGDSLTLLYGWLERQMALPERRKSILHALGKLPESSGYLSLANIRYAYEFGGGAPAEEIEAALLKLRNAGPLYADALYLAICQKCRPEILWETFDLLHLEQYFSDNAFFHFPDLPLQICRLYAKYSEQAGPLAALLQAQLLYWLLPSCPPGGELLVLCDTLANASRAYVQAQGLDSSAESEPPDCLPESIRVGCYFYAALFTGNLQHRMNAVRSAARLSPQTVDAAKTILACIQQSLSAAAGSSPN